MTAGGEFGKEDPNAGPFVPSKGLTSEGEPWSGSTLGLGRLRSLGSGGWPLLLPALSHAGPVLGRLVRALACLYVCRLAAAEATR